MGSLVMFGKKKHFNFNEIVEVKKTGTSLDGEQSRITGVATIGVRDTYIVTFEEPKIGWNQELSIEE